MKNLLLDGFTFACGGVAGADSGRDRGERRFTDEFARHRPRAVLALDGGTRRGFSRLEDIEVDAQGQERRH